MSRYLAIGLGLLALSTSAQDTEIKGARISVVRKPSAVLNVTIENRRDSPLVEVQLGLTPRGAGKGSMFSTRYFGETAPNETVKPHEQRVLETSLEFDPDVETATLTLVVFADGYYEGVATAVEPWRKARQARIDDLRYWSGVLDFMPRVSETDLRAYLASRLADRAGQVVQNPNAPEVRWQLQEVLRRYPSGPEVWSGLEPLRADMQKELAALTTQPPAGASAAVGAVTSAAILKQDRVTSGTVVATIENLRTVPIEAHGLEILDPVTRRPRSGQGADFCNSEPQPEPGSGPIKPGEIREIPLLIPVGPDEALPPVRLAYVIFDDLSYEGAVAPREEALRRREERAADYAFAASVLGQAAGRPASEIQTFLMQKRAERARQLQTAGRRENLMEIDELIRQAKESPDRLLANATYMQERFERQRDRLVRHLAR